METIRLSTDLPKWRADAVARVTEHFNRAARVNLHELLVDLAYGGDLIKSSERRRQDVVGRVARAKTAAEITQIVSELEQP